ncbi:MAG: hypothetical protein JWO05_1045 [Gemmatimonadetes bacterium]|nr:hypothetical protein [Gemmatimonadota bacterium]
MPLLAQMPRDTVVSVTATRTSRIPPDRASFYVIVEGTAETPADANARVDGKLKTVVEALKGFGSRVRLDQPIAYGVGPSPSPNGFPVAAPGTNLARSVIRVQLDRPEQTAQVIAAAIGAGAASSSSLAFESSSADSVRRVRISEALAAARLDAEAVAAALGARLGALVSVSTNSGGNTFGFQTSSTLTFDTRFSSQQAQTPDVVVTTTVTVQYRIIR